MSNSILSILQNELYFILIRLKGFNVGYTSSVENKIIIDFKGRRFVATLEEIEDPSEDMADDVNKIIKGE